MITAYEVDKVRYWQMPLYIFIVCSVVILYLIARFQQSSRTWKMGMKIPGPIPLPLFGNALMVLTLSNKGTVKALVKDDMIIS